MAAKRAPVKTSAAVLSSPILDAIGIAIISGEMAQGDTVTLDALQKRFDVSRTTARDVMRVLESMNLVQSRRRVGLVVQPPETWNVYDARLIRWRLDGPHRDAQLRSLTELRVAIEPIAASAAAQFAEDDDRERIVELAATMRSVGEAGDLEEFLRLDIAFHALLLRASKNEMFAALTDVIAEVLAGRTHHGLMPSSPVDEALREHELIAQAVANREPDAAEQHMLAAVAEVREALRQGDVPSAEDSAGTVQGSPV